MSLDISLCVQGLREANANTPDRTSPTSQDRKTASGNLVDSGAEELDGQDDDGGVEADQETLQRMGMVEERLLELLKQEEDEDNSSNNMICSLIPKGKMPLAHKPHSFPCKDTYTELPSNPSMWPQRPVMIRPTPFTSTVVRGIRRASSNEYIRVPGFCAGCILPINNGNELPGESLVIDFESPHFRGSLLMRIKQAPTHDHGQYNDDATKSYFEGKKRKFQAVVKGRFKTPLKMSQCITGQSFNRPAGKLPARWIVASFVRFVSTLAPQLEATIDGNMPRFLTPLVATAHSVVCKPLNTTDGGESNDATDLEDPVEEPSSVDESSLLMDVKRDLNMDISDTTTSSLTARMKVRKKAYNAVAANKEELPKFALDKEYTFEFYQHLLDFSEDLAVDMGRPIGKVGIAPATDGQPLKFMSAYQDPESGELDSLWSFDIWHESLYPYAEQALKNIRS